MDLPYRHVLYRLTSGAPSSPCCWDMQAIITKEDGGHHFSVHAITVAGNYMFSADRGSNILVSGSMGGPKQARQDPVFHREWRCAGDALSSGTST